LNHILFTLKGLVSLAQKVEADAEKRLDDLSNWHEKINHDTGTVHRLVDLKRCSEWAGQALRQADATEEKFTNIVTALIAEQVFLLLRQPSSYRYVVKKIESVASQLTENSFHSNALEPYALAEGKESLERGKRWQWLYQRAHPLGGVSGSGGQSSFTIMALASDAALTGASGESSEYWQAHWLVARSRQPHEIICLRGVFG